MSMQFQYQYIKCKHTVHLFSNPTICLNSWDVPALNKDKLKEVMIREYVYNMNDNEMNEFINGKTPSELEFIAEQEQIFDLVNGIHDSFFEFVKRTYFKEVMDSKKVFCQGKRFIINRIEKPIFIPVTKNERTT